MAQNKITIQFQGKGHKELRNQINAIAAAQERLNDETKKTNKSFSFFGTTTQRNRKNMGLFGNALATVRSKVLLFNFAVGTLGVKALLDFSKQAAKVESMARAFNTLTGGAEKGSVAVSKLKVATNNTMSEFDLFQQANNAMVLGITKNSDEMAEMFDIAQRLGRALGVDTKRSVESLITGIGRQSRLMLDNIGIIVKADEAYESYADKLGITADKLSDAEKKQAFLEATMDSARAKVTQLGAETSSSQDSFDAFTATVSDLSVALGDKLKGAFSGAMDAFVNFVDLSKSGNVEVALSSMNLDVMVTHLNRYRAELKRLESSFTGRGTMSPELYAQISEQMAIASHNIGNLETHVFELQRQLMSPEGFRFDLFTNFEKTIIEASELNKVIKKIIDEGGTQDTTRGAIQNALFGDSGIDDFLQKYKQIPIRSADFAKTLEKVDITPFTELADPKMKKAEDMISSISSSLASATLNGQNMGEAVVNSLKAIAVQIASKAAIYAIASAFMPGLGLHVGGKAALRFGLGIAHKGGHIKEDGKVQRFATGGVVQGQDNVPILAQAGEFVMQRSAVEAVGLETMNRINQGGSAGSVNISFSGNVMSQDFIEGEAIPMIKEAIRRGADIGVS